MLFCSDNCPYSMWFFWGIFNAIYPHRVQVLYCQTPLELKRGRSCSGLCDCRSWTTCSNMVVFYVVLRVEVIEYINHRPIRRESPNGFDKRSMVAFQANCQRISGRHFGAMHMRVASLASEQGTHSGLPCVVCYQSAVREGLCLFFFQNVKKKFRVGAHEPGSVGNRKQD